MTEIVYKLDEVNGTIEWAASEQFGQLVGKRFYLNEMEAEQIEKLDNFSITAKILLSAVAGATIPHLIDNGFDTELIFGNGSFTVENSTS